jgi:hypothetical protein
VHRRVPKYRRDEVPKWRRQDKVCMATKRG